MATTKFTKRVPKRTPARDIEDPPEPTPARGKRSPSKGGRGQRATIDDGALHHKQRGGAKVPAGKAAPKAASGRKPPGSVAAGIEAALPEESGGPTAKRNAKKRAPRATNELEGSLTDRPSRKSTRGSANRSKRDSNLQRRETRKTTSPESRAERAQAKKPAARGAGRSARVPKGGGGKGRG